MFVMQVISYCKSPEIILCDKELISNCIVANSQYTIMSVDCENRRKNKKKARCHVSDIPLFVHQSIDHCNRGGFLAAYPTSLISIL